MSRSEELASELAQKVIADVVRFARYVVKLDQTVMAARAKAPTIPAPNTEAAQPPSTSPPDDE